MDDSNAKESNEKEEDTNLDETVRQISHLCLDQLSSRWVHQMWDEQFTEAAPPPGGFMREVIQGHEDEVAATLEKVGSREVTLKVERKCENQAISSF